MDTPLSSRTDPALAASRRILSISLWKNTATGEDIVHIQYGAKLDLGSVVGPEGSAIKIRAIEQGYVLEASIPWTALAVPDGRNPFKPGEAMTAVMEVIWGGGDQGRTSMHFHKDPGTFAFEAEVLFSGQGQRGIGTVERHHLYSPRTPQTTLVNDTPTEARLHPSGWGALHVR